MSIQVSSDENLIVVVSPSSLTSVANLSLYSRTTSFGASVES